VFVEGERVPDSSSSEKKGVEEVAVGRGLISNATLGRAKEKGDVDLLKGALFAEPEELGKQVGERPAEDLGAREVVSGHQVRPRKLRCEAVVGVFDDGPWILVSHRRPDGAESPEGLSGVGGPKCGHLLPKDLEHVVIVLVRCL
jgi:hypothetical protein